MEENEAQVEVYPNPTKHLITIEAEGMSEVLLYNTMGQCVMQKVCVGNQTTVDLQNMTEGLYLLHVKTENGVFLKHIAVER
jgi:hypothetical protein